MCSNQSDRYSLDMDEEFEKMLEDIKSTHVHSPQSPAAVHFGFPPNMRLTCSPSLLDIESPSSAQYISLPQPTMKSEVANIQLDKEDSDDSMEHSVELDLNSTYSIKTMGRRKLSTMLTALEESEKEFSLKDQMNLKPSEARALKPNYNFCNVEQRSSHTTTFEISPRTPQYKVHLIPDRSYRLCNVSNYVKSPISTGQPAYVKSSRVNIQTNDGISFIG